MITIVKLALRNLLGAGTRTWLNVFVLSISFVLIITAHGLLEGMNNQIARSMIDSEYGGGQFWHEMYNPYDPFTIQDAHGVIPPQFENLMGNEIITPILIRQGTIYPGGRVRAILLKGIDPEQKILNIPSSVLNKDDDLPVLIGERMARSTGLKKGDYITIQWRDKYGTFDARDGLVVAVMKTPVQSIDINQAWIPISSLQSMTGLYNEATYMVIRQNEKVKDNITGWKFHSQDLLLEDINRLVRSKAVGSMIVYALLLSLAMLAIFDTQVVSIFRRRREIGTLMALGMDRGQVIRLFTMEGALNGVLAALLGSIYATPLLSYFSSVGWTLSQTSDSYGFAIGDTLYPTFSVALIIIVTLLVLFTTTFVSYLPARQISKLLPTDALRGRIT